jgi:hypothetical protein
MSTKKLSHTVKDTGRSSKKDRRFLNKEYRANERAYLDNVRKDIAFADDDKAPYKTRMWHSYRGGLNYTVVYRWLHSRVGLIWNDVRSELSQDLKSDSESFKRVVDQVENRYYHYYYKNYHTDIDTDTQSYSKNEFYIDDSGILRVKEHVSRGRLAHCDTKKVSEWLDGRVIAKVGNKLFWCKPVGKSSWSDEWRCTWHNYGGLVYEKLVYYPVWKDGVIVDTKPQWKAYVSHMVSRQDKEFNKKEVEFWNTIPEYYQKIILRWSPNSKDPPKLDWWNRYY